jgi:hypothetical protein
MTPEESKNFRDLNQRWLSGELVEGLAFRHNSIVEASLSSGDKIEGWIVSASEENGIMVYTVESRDGSGDYYCTEDQIRNIENESAEPADSVNADKPLD